MTRNPWWLPVSMIVVAWLGASPGSAADVESPTQHEGLNRPRICLVLSGGGALGAAHVGALKVIEEARVPIDCVAGTSMGAIIGALYATGYTAAELEDIVHNLDMSSMFIDEPPRREMLFRRKVDDLTVLTDLEFGFSNGRFLMPRGLVAGQKFGFVFQELLLPAVGVPHFDDLPIPFRTVATDIETGEMVVLEDGDLGQAIRASMSVPGAFSPVPVGDSLLVDGGLVRNLPVSVARDLGADVVIAVDVGASDSVVDSAELDSAAEILGRMVSIMIRENVRHEADDCEVLIEPDLEGFTSRDFVRMGEMIPSGEAAAREVVDQLRELALDEAAYRQWRSARRPPELAPMVVSGIQLGAYSEIDSRTILRSVSTRPGDALDFDRLWQDLVRLYRLGDFQIVDVHFQRTEDGYDVIIDARPKSWGPNYLRFGINLESDFEGDSDFNLLTQYLMTNVNRWRGELKFRIQFGADQLFMAEYYQPLSFRGDWFFSPMVTIEETAQDIDLGSGLSTRYTLDSALAEFDLGYQLGRFGELRLGVASGRVRARPKDEDTILDAFDIDVAGYRGQLVLDQLDDPDFPRSGYFLDFEAIRADPSLGSDDRFTQLDLTALGAIPLGDGTLMVSLEGSRLEDFEAPVAYAGSALGGLFRLSGRARDSLYGKVSALGVLFYLYELKGATSPFGTSVYVGGTVEAGNAWLEADDVDWGDLEHAASVFVGTDTFVGPVYLAYGRTDDDRDAWYFFVGRSF